MRGPRVDEPACRHAEISLKPRDRLHGRRQFPGRARSQVGVRHEANLIAAVPRGRQRETAARRRAQAQRDACLPEIDVAIALHVAVDPALDRNVFREGEASDRAVLLFLQRAVELVVARMAQPRRPVHDPVAGPPAVGHIGKRLTLIGPTDKSDVGA